MFLANSKAFIEVAYIRRGSYQETSKKRSANEIVDILRIRAFCFKEKWAWPLMQKRFNQPEISIETKNLGLAG